MSTIEDVRRAQKRVDEIVTKLRNAGAVDPDNLNEELRKATDDYAKAVRELEAK